MATKKEPPKPVRPVKPAPLARVAKGLDNLARRKLSGVKAKKHNIASSAHGR